MLCTVFSCGLWSSGNVCQRSSLGIFFAGVSMCRLWFILTLFVLSSSFLSFVYKHISSRHFFVGFSICRLRFLLTSFVLSFRVVCGIVFLEVAYFCVSLICLYVSPDFGILLCGLWLHFGWLLLRCLMYFLLFCEAYPLHGSVFLYRFLLYVHFFLFFLHLIFYVGLRLPSIHFCL